MNLSVLDLVTDAQKIEAQHLERDRISITRIQGGANNTIYRAHLDGEDFAVKLCVKDERHRARREFNALTLLCNAELSLAPKPV